MELKRVILAVEVWALGMVSAFIYFDKPAGAESKAQPPSEPSSALLEYMAKEKGLPTMRYSGTLDEVLTQRGRDANDLLLMANVLISELNEPNKTITERERKALEGHIRVHSKYYQKMEMHDRILKMSHAVMLDPNHLPSIDDPNYADELVRRNRLLNSLSNHLRPK
jgi:hypothetical protein